MNYKYTQAQAHINQVISNQSSDVRLFHMAFQYTNTTGQTPEMITVSNKLVSQLETASHN